MQLTQSALVAAGIPPRYHCPDGLAAWRVEHTCGAAEMDLRTAIQNHAHAWLTATLRAAAGAPRPNLILEGAPGTGKTLLACALLAGAALGGRSGWFLDLDLFCDSFRGALTGKDPAAIATMRKIETKALYCDVLVLDDMGLEAAPLSSWASRTAYQLINARYNDLRPCVVTCARVEDITNRYGPAIAGRLLELSKVESRFNHLPDSRQHYSNLERG